MRIIDINRVRSPQSIVHRKKQNLSTIDCRLSTALFIIIAGILSGCGQDSRLEQARDYAQQSQAYYQQAVAKYEDLIAQGKDLDQAYFELGLLYYKHAEYELAGSYLSKTNLAGAGKYRALALYRINDFTEAKDAFKRIDNPDSETLYYYGQVCEKLNLHDQALEIYGRVSQEPFKSRAQEQIQSISKTGQGLYLEDLAPDLQEIIRAAPSAEKYPNAGALILFCDEEIELTEQDTAVFSEHFLIKVLNERGKQDFAEVVIGYDSTYDKVELEYARTIRPDGIVVPVGSRHIRDVSKYLNFPLYSNARARIISFPEITQGCLIEYKYRIHRNQLINDDDLVINYKLQEQEPVIQARLRLLVPADKPVHYKILNPGYNTFRAQLKPQIEPAPVPSSRVKQSPEYKQYTWEFRDIPAIIPEADMPPYSRIDPIILISTFNSWQEVYDWWWGLAEDKIEADEAIKQKAVDLTAGKETALQKAEAIYNFCAEDIRYVAVEYGQAGHEPHKASDIFFNKYGDCKDQAILLISMLRQMGIQAYPVLIGTYDHLDLEEDFPSLNFNHAIAAADLGEGLVFLDPTCSTCRLGNLPADDQERKVLVFTDSGYKIEATPVYPLEHNQVRRTLSIQINPDETIRSEREVYTFGLYDAAQRLWLKYSSDDAISESLKQAIQGISPAARLISYNIENLDDLSKSLVLNYSFSGREYWSKSGNLRILPQLAGLDTSLIAKQLRRYPLELGLPSTSIIELDIRLPAGVKLRHLPDNFEQSSPWLDVSIEYDLKESHLYFKQIKQTKTRHIPLSQYPEFKNFIEKVSTQIRERVIFQYD
jgi:transglutaminase-like putative cysteine protease